MTKINKIKKAIKNKIQVIATYNGERREMCPHIIGLKDGTRQVLFYQFGGGSKSGLDHLGSRSNWRCIPVRKLRDVEVREGDWYTANNYSYRSQECIDRISKKVES